MALPPNVQVKTGKLRKRGTKVTRPAKPRAPKPAAKPKPVDPLAAQAAADAQLRYGDAILRAQALGPNAVHYFENYKADVARANAEVAARTAAAQAQAAGLGPTVGPATGTAPGSEGAAAAASRGVLQQNLSNYLGSQGNAYENYFTGRGTVGSAQELQTQLQAQAQIAQLAQQKGAYQTSRLGELQTAAHRQALEDAAFGLNVQKAKTPLKVAKINAKTRIKTTKITNRAKQQASNQRVNQWGYTDGEWRKMSPAQRQSVMKQEKGYGKTGKSAFSPKETAANRVTLRKAVAKVRQYDNGTTTYRGEAIKNLIDAGADPLLARVAAALGTGSPISAATARAIYRDYGIRVKAKPVKRPKPTLTPDVAQAPGPNGQTRPN
jgi:hypothetical protein